MRSGLRSAAGWPTLFPALPHASEVNRRSRWLYGAFEQIRHVLLARHGAHTVHGVLTRTAATIAAHCLIKIALPAPTEPTERA